MENKTVNILLCIFYVIMIAVGALICFTKGEAAVPETLVSMSVCVYAVFALKLTKYKGKYKENAGDIVFMAILCLVALVADIVILFR